MGLYSKDDFSRADFIAFLDADEIGVILYAAGHFETEMIAIKPLLKKIENEFKIDCILAEQDTPIKTI